MQLFETPVDQQSVYLANIDKLLGRALSQLDSEETSISRGSFDRTWWCWKFTDFSATRFQEGAYCIAWLATNKHVVLSDSQRKSLIEKFSATLHFWSELQNKDGSFDEAYPNERSLAATAFTSFYVGSALELMKNEIDISSKTLFFNTLKKACDWLSKNGEYHGILSNHLAAAAAALQVASDLLSTKEYLGARDHYLALIYENQNLSEGWFREYGGADPGYQSHGMFYLSDIYKRTGDEKLLASLQSACDFMKWFVHPDGSIGGEYASRGTKFAYPAAFEMLAEHSSSAASIAQHLRQCALDGKGVSAWHMDSWNLFPMLNNLLFAANNALTLKDPQPLPWLSENAIGIFQHAGFVSVSTDKCVAVISGSMGGTIKLWNKNGQLLFEDCGYYYKKNTLSFSNQGHSPFELSDNGVSIELTSVSTFRKVQSIRFSSWKFLGFRLFTLIFGKFPKISKIIKSVLVNRLIYKSDKTSGKLTRKIIISQDHTISIQDCLTDLQDVPRPLPRHVPFHMGSARYAHLNDWFGAKFHCSEPEKISDGEFIRNITLSKDKFDIMDIN